MPCEATGVSAAPGDLLFAVSLIFTPFPDNIVILFHTEHYRVIVC